MSTGQWLGGAVGGILGAIIGSIIPGIGTIIGAIYGACIGYVIGGYIDPVKPDQVNAAIRAQSLETMSNILGQSIFDGLGTSKYTGFLLAYGQEYKLLTGYRSHHQTVYTGYKYYATWAVGIMVGVADTLYTIFNEEKVIWSGELNRPAGGVSYFYINDFGYVTFYFGTNDQPADATMAQLIGSTTLNSPFRGLCWAILTNCFIGENFNRIPTMRFVIRKTPELSFSDKHLIQTLDYNPAHAMWHILARMTNLPEEWLSEEDFTDFAETLYSENRGISMNFDRTQGVNAWLESLQYHIDSILRYGSDGKFHPKLIRNDYDVDALPVCDESILQEEPAISRPSWIDTIGELKAQYSQILRTTYTLTIVKKGNGSGEVTDSYEAIDCGLVCEGTYPEGTNVVLTATPAFENTFLGWEGEGFSGTDPIMVNMDSNKTIEAVFMSGLWAWFKHDEESGLVIVDHSYIAIPGTLSKWSGGAPDDNQRNYFWNTNPGFGTGSNNFSLAARVLRVNPSRSSGYVSLVAFIKPLGDGPSGAHQAIQLGESGLINYLAVGWDHAASPPRYLGFSYSNGWKASTYALTYGEWYCVFAYSQADANNNGLYIRKSGDLDWTLVLKDQGVAAHAGVQTGVYMFGGTNNPISMVGGDGFYFADSTPFGIISLEEATELFNLVKERCLMT